MKERISCGMLIKQINDSMRKQVNNHLRSCDLTMAQVGVLLELRKNTDQQMTLKELERSFRVAQSTAAGLVSRLEQKNFVESFGDSITISTSDGLNTSTSDDSKFLIKIHLRSSS